MTPINRVIVTQIMAGLNKIIKIREEARGGKRRGALHDT